MLRKIENGLKKVVFPTSERLRDISMVMIVFVVLIVVADVCARRLFNSPIRGTNELCALAFSIMTFFPLAWCAFKGAHVEIDILTRKFPKNMQSVVEMIIMFLTTVMLGILSWRLIVYAIFMQGYNVKSSLMGIIIYPFLYAGAFGYIMVTLAFFIRFLSTLRTFREGRQ